MFSLLNIRIGFFLALRQIRRSSKWTTGLIIFVMVLTFLNLVVVSGILVGLIQGSVDAIKAQYTGEVIISNLKNKNFIEHSSEIISNILASKDIESITPRYIEGGTIEAGYKTRTNFQEKANIASSQIVGIDPLAEDRVTNLSKYIIEGEYLSPGDYDQIVLGSFLIKKYIPIDSPGFSALDDVSIGTKVRVKVNGTVREMTVKGILKTKVDEVSFRAYMIDSQLRSLIGRNDFNVDEVAIRLKPGIDPSSVRDVIKISGADQFAKIQTSTDAEPKFIKDIRDTFSLLGNMIGSIGLVVASITIFIVIFINAITRRKFIGILKGIGISGQAIEMAYVMQSIFYAFIGSSVGLVLLYVFLQPFIASHPINFPFSDGILVAPLYGTLIRVGLLIGATIIAGYIPARMIVRKNTLDSILGRK